ncbi:MAG TPA: hypothetical protein VK348_06505 [Planctomycetota bacterium]|nr:hypothetical protein [Planctomycetota bacterium]
MRCRPGSLVPLLLAAALGAQDRKPAFVRVFGSDGKPLAAAAVTLFGEVAIAPELAPVDVVKVTTDDKGRARADLLLCVGYSAYAVGPADAAGVQQVTEVADGAACSRTVELRADRSCGTRELRGDGIAAWQAEGPLQVRAGVGTRMRLWLPLPLQDDKVALPPLPGNTRVQVLDARGQLLQTGAPGEGDAAVLALPPRRLLPVLVVDDKGAPVAGAEIWHQVATEYNQRLLTYRRADSWRVCGVTGVDGTAQAVVASAMEPLAEDFNGQLQLAAGKPGFAESVGGWLGRERIVDNKRVEAGKVSELRFTLTPQAPLRGRLLQGEVPLANRQVLLCTQVRITQGQGGWSSWPRTFSTQTEADGSYAFAVLPSLQDPVQLAIGPVPPPADAGSKVPFVPAGPLLGGQKVPAEPPTIDLARTANLSLQVLDLQNGPARNADAALVPLINGNLNLQGWALEFPLDPAGRAVARALPGSALLFAFDCDGFASQLLEFDGKPVDLKLQLQPFACMQVRVLDADGQPVEGARLQIRRTSFHGGGGNREQDLLRNLAHQVNGELLRRSATAADGSIAAHFLDLPGSSFGVAAQKEHKQSIVVPLAAGDTVDLRLQ